MTPADPVDPAYPTAARIVVGYDGSPDADLALQWAADTARRRGGTALDVVVVVTQTDPLLGLDREHGEHAAEESRDLVAQLLSSWDDVPHRVSVRRGGAVATLLAAAHHATLLVVGSRGHGLLTGSLTGSVSQHLARHATCPVVVVRRPHRPDAHHIVVGLDGSPESQRALHLACDLATHHQQAVIALHAYHAYTTAKGSLDDLTTTQTALRIQHAERLLDDWTRPARDDHPEVDISTETVATSPTRALVDSSAVASLLVLGSRGHDAFADLMLGSVSQHVLTHAHCPVAIVR